MPCHVGYRQFLVQTQCRRFKQQSEATALTRPRHGHLSGLAAGAAAHAGNIGMQPGLEREPSWWRQDRRTRSLRLGPPRRNASRSCAAGCRPAARARHQVDALSLATDGHLSHSVWEVELQRHGYNLSIASIWSGCYLPSSSCALASSCIRRWVIGVAFFARSGRR